MAFTWWKFVTSNLRRARLRRRRRLCQQSKQSAMGAGETFFRRALNVSRAKKNEANKLGVVCIKNAQHGEHAGAVSRRQQRPHPQKYCLPVRGKTPPDPSSPPIRPGGKRVVLRAGKYLRAGLSGAYNHGDNGHGQGERTNIPVAMCSLSDRECQEHRSSSPTSVENRTPSIHMAQQVPSNYASGREGSAGKEGSAEEATPQYAQSPFVVGGPLCAEYPSYWNATGISAFNTVGPRPFAAWTTGTAAEKQQQVSASGPVPSEGGSNRRGLSAPPSRSNSTSRYKHRRTYSPKEIAAGKGDFPSCMGDAHHKDAKNKLAFSIAAGVARVSRSVFCDVSQDLPGRMRASTAPSRCTAYNTAVHRGVGRRFLPHQGVFAIGEQNREIPWEPSSMCFGRCIVLVD